MPRSFLASFLAGLALMVALAGYFPLPDHLRFRSRIDVLANGGRQEIFVVEWPGDRVPLYDRSGATARAGTAGTVVFEGSGKVPVSAELFRLRDTQGNVIGIATRMTGRLPGQRVASASASNWMLAIPARGKLLLTQENSADVGLLSSPGDPGVAIAPIETARFWEKASRYRITAGPAPDGRGKVIGGTEEFDGLTGSYTEIWELEEVGADGQTRGRILLSTITAGASL